MVAVVLRSLHFRASALPAINIALLDWRQPEIRAFIYNYAGETVAWSEGFVYDQSLNGPRCHGRA